MKKKVGFILGGGAAVVLILVIGVLLFVDVDQYRPTIETRLEQQLGRDVTLGELSLGLLPLRIEVAETRIGEDPALGNRPDFVSTERLGVRVGLLSLLAGNIEVASLDLERPSVELVKTAAGTWNFSTLGSASGPTTPTDSVPDASEESPDFTLSRLRINDGQIAVTDLAGETRAVYDHIDLTLRDFAPGQPFSFEVAALLPGEGAGELRLEGTGGPVMPDNPLDTPFSGTLSLREVAVEGLKAFLDTEVLADSGGWLSGETALTNTEGLVQASGNLELGDASFNGIDVGYPITVDYDLDAALTESLYTIDVAAVRLGATPVSLSGQIDAGAEPARVDLHIVSEDVSISEVARLASAFGVAFDRNTEVAGRMSMNLQATGPVDRLGLTGSIAGRDLRISGSRVPQPVEVAEIDVALSPSEIRSNEFAVSSGETQATARFALSNYTSDTPSIDAGLRAPGATLPEIQSIASAYGMTGLDQIDGTGSLGLDLAASGRLDSLDSTSMARALNGTVNLDFSPLNIAGFDTANELGAIGGFTTGTAADNLTELLRLTGQIVVTNGVARTDDLLATLAIGNISAAGTADLAEETLDLRLSAVLSQAFSQTVGATDIGGYLTTALTNDAGEIVLPVRMTGTFDQPLFTPDVQAFTQMQRQRLLPTFDDPGAAVSNILGAFAPQSGNGNEVDDNGEASEPPAETEPVQAIRGILGGLFGGGSDDKN